MPRAIEINKLSAVLPDKIDIFLVFASFETRTAVASSGLAHGQALNTVLFYTEGCQAIVSDNLAELQKLHPNSRAVAVNASNSIAITDKFIDEISRAVKDKPNKCTAVVDATTFTRESLLILLRVLREFSSYIGSCTFLYTPAKSMSLDWLSKGVIDYRPIIGYLGEFSPVKKLHLVLMMGFEIDRARNIVMKYEPDLISIGVGSQVGSINNELYEKNKRFADELQITLGVNVGRFEFSLTEPYATKKLIMEYLEKFGDEYNTVIAPLNNKLSTLGAGLFAIDNTGVQLCYAQPELYNIENYSTPENECYVTKIDLE